jgi:hypothetical protein
MSDNDGVAPQGDAGAGPPANVEAGAPPDQQRRIADRIQRENTFRGGADWYFWIAGLSVVNSLLSMTNSSWGFPVGLGVTQVFDAFGRELVSAARIIPLVLSVIFSSVFVAFGILARKRYRWAFPVGMAVYFLDGLLFLLVGEWVGFGFHLFALWGIYGGYKALKALEVEEESEAAALEG